MKNHPFPVVLLLIALLFAACSKLKKATDFITQPTAREVYARDFDSDSLPYLNWKRAFNRAFQDRLEITTPYLEQGILKPEVLPVYAYDLELERGRDYAFRMETDSLKPLVFIDLYQKTSDSITPYKLVEQAKYETSTLNFSPKKSGVFKIIFQPQLEAHSNFQIAISSTPIYGFPVAGVSAKAIQSFWGANRDGGRRSHEGVDIFAPRGTPVLAGVAGFVSSTGNRGLGGKQVWLRDGLLGNSLYHAHLDSIIVTRGQRVKVGDTLGLVGNTGNARTTAPHLHFGVYTRGGAINPLAFINTETQTDQRTTILLQDAPYQISSRSANLRTGPAVKAQKSNTLTRGDTLHVLGATSDWLHIKTTQNERAFLHSSLAKPLN